MKRGLGVLAAGVALMAAAPITHGGWAVITVQDVPTRLEVGKATQLAFTVLQHGRTPLRDLEPTVTVTPEGSKRGDVVRARVGRKAGQYVAIITPRAAGMARIAIDANWRDTRTELLPIPVNAPGVQAASRDDARRGGHLFVAKGCVTCHAKRDEPALRGRLVVEAGPELTGRTWPAEWLASKLADPTRVRGGARGDLPMPDLDLTASEIAALVAYLNRSAAPEVSAR